MSKKVLDNKNSSLKEAIHIPQSAHFETLAIRTQSANDAHKEHSAPIYMTSSFTFESAEEAVALFSDQKEGNIYSRYSNPNNNEFITKLCQMEGAEDGLSTASGMAAMFSSMAALLKSGDHVLACRSVFGSTHQILNTIFADWGITYTYADIDKPEEWESLIKPETKMIFLETPSNPGLDIIDLDWVGQLAEKHDLILNVDNCFATPYIQQPIRFGAHLVTHSATKFMDGQGRVLGGAIVGKKELIDKIRFFARHTGPSLSPFNAWTLSKSMETLAIRMEAHCKSAFEIAEVLEGHEAINFVKYPFLPSHKNYDIAKRQMKLGGGLFTFSLKGGKQAAMAFINELKLITRSSNLGDTRTIATHPASTTHSKLTEEERLAVGITDGLIRISVGLENVNDILDDIINAIRNTKQYWNKK